MLVSSQFFTFFASSNVSLLKWSGSCQCSDESTIQPQSSEWVVLTLFSRLYFMFLLSRLLNVSSTGCWNHPLDECCRNCLRAWTRSQIPRCWSRCVCIMPPSRFVLFAISAFAFLLCCSLVHLSGVLSAIIVMENLPQPRPDIDHLGADCTADPEGKIQVLFHSDGNINY